MGILFNALTEGEKEAIIHYIKNYSNDDLASPTPERLQDILTPWEEAKEINLFQLLGGNLILEREVEFKKPKEQLVKDLEEFVYKDGGHPCYRKISDFLFSIRSGSVRNLIHTWGYTQQQAEDMVLEWRRWGGNFDALNLLMNFEHLVENKFEPWVDPRSRTYIEFPLPNSDKKLKFSYGEKMIKIYKKLCNALNIEEFEDFRIHHSQILNQKKLKGQLCLSIHPLDYMTMSDNDCGWDSCMSWREYGDYRQGTVEMMNSKYVIMAYLKSDTNVTFTTPIEWSNKKWRQLFVVSPELLLGIRQYPYDSDELRGTALNWIRELAIKNLSWHQFPETTVLADNMRSNTFGDRTVRIQLNMNHMYNDISRGHLAYVSDEVKDLDVIDIFLSGVPECMLCGSTHDISNSCDLICETCGGGLRCEHCGRTIYADNCYWVGDLRYCEDCYYDYTTTCATCLQNVENECIINVHLRINDIQLPYYGSVCNWCYDNNASLSRLVHYSSKEIDEHYINIEEILYNDIETIEDVFEITDWEYFQKDVFDCLKADNLDDHKKVMASAKNVLKTLKNEIDKYRLDRQYA